ncbi:MAG: shikimate kinase [Clostridia bacterium]|nr:shikimate kinase [Clostridia bacterium]
MQKFGLLGRKLGHSFSPQIHSHLYDAPYDLFEREHKDVEAFMKNGDFDAINVTIPYKKDVVPFCAELSDTAKRIGSVNTIVKRADGSFYGDNTDYYGLSYMILKSGISVKGKKAIILGSGGASLTAQKVLSDMEVSSLSVISRASEDNYDNLYEKHHDAEIILNATPVGMFPNNGESLIDMDKMPKLLAVFDMIYNPSKPKLLLDAESRGIPFVNGLPMLVAQAKKSAEMFLGHSIPDEKIEKIIKALEQQTKNIILIGMPGCGKSTIGKKLSAMLNRPLLDTDTELEKTEGRSIPDIINTDGEETFRMLETKTLADVSKLSGQIIATGGGIITREENFPLLKQNSVIFYLNRSLSDLPTKGRPLSGKYGVEALFEARKPLYEKAADYIVDVCGVNETANKVKELFFA